MNQSLQFHDAAAGTAEWLAIDELPLPYLEIDVHGIITRVNRAALALHPPEQGELVGQLAFALLAGGDREPTAHEFAAMMASHDDDLDPVVRYLYDRSGKYSAYQLFRRVMRDAAGKPTGMRIVGINISEMTQALEETRRRSQWLESIVDSMQEAIIATDVTGVIMGVNSAAEELLGWKSAELVGKILEEAIRWRSIEASDKSPIDFAMALTGRRNGLSRLADRHGREIVVRVWISPVLDKKTSSVAGIVLMMYRPGTPFAVPC
jgi:PAS domain S-box-containing protein